MKRSAWAWVASVGLVAGPGPRASASGAELAIQGAITDRRALDAADAQLGLRLSWQVKPWFAVDAELSLAPGDLGGARAFSGSRRELMAGVRFARDLAASGPYGLLRAGQVRFAEAPQPIACILIFPPPLNCSLAAGADVTAIEFGAGYQRRVGERGRAFVELRDHVVRYEGPVLDGIEARLDGFWSHNPRFVAGFGWSF